MERPVYVRKTSQENELEMLGLCISRFSPKAVFFPLSLLPLEPGFQPETGFGSCLHLSFLFGLDAHDCINLFFFFFYNNVALISFLLTMEPSGPP